MSIDIDYIIGDDIALVDGRRYVRESYLDEAKAENAELRKLLADNRDAMWDGGEWTEPFDERMHELGIEVE